MHQIYLFFWAVEIKTYIVKIIFISRLDYNAFSNSCLRIQPNHLSIGMSMKFHLFQKMFDFM